MADVRFEQATRIYDGTDTPAVDALDLTIADGEFLVLVGPSGSGKTTALRMLAGLEQVDGGMIWIGERDVTDMPPKQRDVAMVFQNYALYPYLTVEANIGFPLRVARVPKSERAGRVRVVAQMLGLEPYLERKPGQLSGGQRQRVAMGRAIIRQPRVFLMDEPLSNLDAKLRVQMRAEIAALQSRLGITTVYVTHDQSEAMTLGDRVAVLGDGRLQQCDTPRELYERPANTFVAGFIGSPAMNLCRAPIDANGSVSLGGADVPLTRASRGELDGDVIVGLRPEALDLVAGGIPAVVEVVEEIGADAYVFVAAELNGQETKLVARIEARRAPERGERVSLRPRAAEAHLFHPETGDRVS
jgi:multiple sugar transport system ATP-binding protein